MCIRDSTDVDPDETVGTGDSYDLDMNNDGDVDFTINMSSAVSYTHLRAHETVLDLVCRLLLENKNTNNIQCAHCIHT